MKSTFSIPAPNCLNHFFFRVITLLLLGGSLMAGNAFAGGTWTALAHRPPGGLNNALLMSDGTVICGDGGQNWYRLTPDNRGSYANGTWTQIASMNYSRLFYSSAVLTNGNVYVAGGEYGSGDGHAELYDSLANTWTVIPQPAGVNFSDAASKILPNGNVLQSDSQSGIYLYNAFSNIITANGTAGDQNEACWVRLPSDNILTIIAYGQTSQHYVPALNRWFSDGNTPQSLYGYGGELGPGFVLPNGNVFYIGATPYTAIYTPGAAIISAGTWTAGPSMVFGTNALGAVDAPAAMMVNGKILCALGGTNGFDNPVYFYEYDYVSNAFTQVNGPNGLTEDNTPFATDMLDLPDGSVLFVDGQGTTSLYIYHPDGSPLAAGQPVINSITENTNGSYHLVGVGLNGITGGAAYGDDWQMDTSYPLVRLTNNVSKNVYYARTYQWTSTTIQNPNPVSTEFTLPQNLPAGTYSLVVTANGNASAPQTFVYSPPSVPTGLTASPGNGQITLTWNPSAGATGYIVKRATSNNGYFVTLSSPGGTSYVDSHLTNGLTYYYRIAAIGSSGPSSDSTPVSAIPNGPPIIPGATPVSLAGFYNRSGIYTDGLSFTSGGMDGIGSAFSANLLEPSLLWNNLVFNFGPANAPDAVACASQVIHLPGGTFNSVQILATGINGGQTFNNTFVVTYTDTTTVTFTQNFSDWANAQAYPGEFTAIKMPYRNLSSGGSQSLNMAVDGYFFPLDQTKTVQSITLPNNANIVLLAMTLANEPVAISLTNFYNRAGIYSDGTNFANVPNGGIDGGNKAYSATLLGASVTWSNTFFNLGPLNDTNVISCASQIIPLVPGSYSRLEMLATGVQGNQTSQPFLVTYTDATTATFFLNLSDWFSPQNYAGESLAFPMSYRNNGDGTKDTRPFNLYGYTFTLNSAKQVQSIRLPNNVNVIVTAISAVPNWSPTFSASPFTLANANVGHFYVSTIATNATDLNGDTLTYAKIGGPTWLTVAANGTVSGTPAITDVNTNSFVVSVKDAAGTSNTAAMSIDVNGAPSFVANPFAEPAIIAGQSYSGTIATNVTDPNPGDVFTFAKISGPAWLTVATNGTLSGTPLSGDVTNGTYTLSVTDAGGLSATGTMTIAVAAAAPIVSSISVQGTTLLLNWSGGITPYQVQATTNLTSPDWQNLGDPVSGNTLSITPSNNAMYYRLIGQ
jgi:hypothetical protein